MLVGTMPRIIFWHKLCIMIGRVLNCDQEFRLSQRLLFVLKFKFVRTHRFIVFVVGVASISGSRRFVLFDDFPEIQPLAGSLCSQTCQTVPRRAWPHARPGSDIHSFRHRLILAILTNL